MAAKLYVNGCSDLSNLLELCAIPKQQLSIDENFDTSSSKPPALTFPSGVTVHGLRTVAVYLARVANECGTQCDAGLLGESPLERAEVDQWLEYRQTEVDQALHDRTLLKSILQDLDSHLEQKVYLVGHRLTLADVMLHYALHVAMTEMTHQEKETLINVSRWFCQVQNSLASRQNLPLVTFQRNLLYS